MEREMLWRQYKGNKAIVKGGVPKEERLSDTWMVILCLLGR